MDTPTIAQYYREQDPLKRKALLEQAVLEGEEPEANQIRQQLWEGRYDGKPQAGSTEVADNYLGMWMCLEFNRDAESRLFGTKNAVKEIRKQFEKLKFAEISAKSELHRELLYREICHLVRVYMELCEQDRSYNTTLFGIMTMKKQDSFNKLKRDIYETAVRLPATLGMEEEFSLITRAAREMYELKFPGQGGLP